jgi:hypothetical protein
MRWKNDINIAPSGIDCEGLKQSQLAHYLVQRQVLVLKVSNLQDLRTEFIN